MNDAIREWKLESIILTFATQLPPAHKGRQEHSKKKVLVREIKRHKACRLSEHSLQLGII